MSSKLSSDNGILHGNINPTTFTKAQKRWRIAYTAIHFTLHLAKDIVPEKRANFSIAQKRWRLAYTVIYSSRAILSLIAAEMMPESPNRDHTVLEIEQIIPRHGFDQTTSRSHLLEIDDADDLFVPDIDISKLTEMVKEKDLNELSKFGGIKGLTKALKTDPENGITGNDYDYTRRKTTFGTNTYNKPPPKKLLHFVVEAFKDITILILMACAALSLGFGIKEHGGKEGWYEGGSIFVAVFVVVAVSSLSNLRQERQFDKLSKISNDIKIDVMRDGRRQKISIFDIVVGDVVILTIGDQIPADGIFLSGHSFQVDESSMTGESDHVEVDKELNPFLLSGSKVADGYARILVTSVGMNTSWGNMMSSIARNSNERTPLQARLDKLTSSIGKVGLSVALLVLLVLLIRYFTGNTKDVNGNREFNGSRTTTNDVFDSVVRIVAAAVTIVVVAIPEGLPLAVTLTLAYSMKRMMADQAMVRKLSACETMGSATVILLGIVGLKDPCRPGARKAIQICRSAGVDIKMITGDNVFTAKAIATECGILGPYDQQVSRGEVVEGVEFRNYTHEERMEKVDRILVMARSSPFDKLLMVQCLKQKGHVVAVTGDGTNDAPALKEADVGLSMGIQGTEVAKESSDIVILDDDFASVATVLRWGRCVYNNIQKFIQFQLTVNVAALVINFIAAVSAGEVPLTAVQLLWVNLIMDTLGALALATERPTDELMHKPPVGRTEPLITNIMWRNLLAQALYQIAILLTFQFRGKSIFNVSDAVKNTLIFNTFVFCQVFNEFNSRKLEKKNVFTGIHKNRLFLGIVAVTVVLQIVMVEFLFRINHSSATSDVEVQISDGSISNPLPRLLEIKVDSFVQQTSLLGNTGTSCT